MATATTVKHAIIAGIPVLWAAPTVPSSKLVIWRAQRFVNALRATIYAQQPDRLAVFLQPDTAHKFTPLMWTNARTWFRRYL